MNFRLGRRPKRRVLAVGMGDEDMSDGLVLDRTEQRADVALVCGPGGRR